MASSYSVPSSCGLGRLSLAPMVRKGLRAQISSGEEDNHADPVNYGASEGLRGKKLWRSTVDENMGVLRGRIEVMRAQERLLIRRSRGHVTGWDPYYPVKHNPEKLRGDDASALESLEVAGVVVLSLGLPLLGGTLCLCLVAWLLHLGG